MHRLFVESLAVRSFRNLDSLAIRPCARFNVLSGENGQGKTNLLEALYVLGTSKSFRASKLSEVVSFDQDAAAVRGVIVEADWSRKQEVVLRAGARRVVVDGTRPPTLSDYAVRTPLVVFHPGELSLSMGPSSERRRLIDRVSLYVEPLSFDELDRYTKALRARQKILDVRGPSAPDLGAWEELCVTHGSAIMAARERSAAKIAVFAGEAFARIAAPGLTLEVEYAPSAPRDRTRYLEALSAKRVADAARGNASVGPHRDDVVLRISGRPVRGVASQGQHRAVTLALKSSEIDVIGESRGVRPILLLDDVSSELDRERTSALFSFLRERDGQVFLTTTRPDLLDTGRGAERADFSVRAGVVQAM